jgi:quercetin dioxygenase-like cupin family protein
MTGSGPEKWAPTTRDTADHSLPYIAARTMFDGDITNESYAPEKLRDPRILAFMRKITVIEDPVLTARIRCAHVTFEPGARTAWHTHPLGQTLIVTSGLGRVQRQGGPAEEIHPGDVVWFAPGEKHWHGASPGTAMSHIAIQEALNGSPVDWMDHVTDEQYAA